VWILVSRRNGIFLTALLAATLAFAALAQAAAAASVTVELPSGQSKVVELSSLTPDVNETYGNSHVSGFSLRALLVAADAETVYRSVKIVTAGGTVSQTKLQIESGQRPPVLYESGGEVWFVYGSAAPQLVTGSISQSQSSADGPVAKAKASRSKAKVRQSISYTASVSNAAAGEQFTYTWWFDDNTTATGKTVRHKFKTRGLHKASLTVTPVGATDSSTNAYAAVTVQVGAATKSKKKRAGSGTNDASGAPATGSADGASGSGDAASAQSETPKKKRKQPAAKQAEELSQIEGQLLSPENQASQPTTAARSGQQAQQAEQNSVGVTTEQAAGASALLLLGYGALLEMGVLRKFRPRMLSN
jgi:PKD repeat protein